MLFSSIVVCYGRIIDVLLCALILDKFFVRLFYCIYFLPIGMLMKAVCIHIVCMTKTFS